MGFLLWKELSVFDCVEGHRGKMLAVKTTIRQTTPSIIPHEMLQ
jgi:hypothetical protein